MIASVKITKQIPLGRALIKGKAWGIFLLVELRLAIGTLRFPVIIWYNVLDKVIQFLRESQLKRP